MAGGHAPVSAPPRSSAFGPRWTARPGPGPSCVDPVQRNYPLKNNSLFWVISEILQKGPWTLSKSTGGPDFALKPMEFEK
jgi:hypothetical protein